MAVVTFNSGMDDFCLIRRICRIGRHAAAGTARLDGNPSFAGLEAMAQLAAWHCRYRVAFNRHAFLLKILRYEPMDAARAGSIRFLFARLTAEAAGARSYAVSAWGPAGRVMRARLLIGMRDYDDVFRAKGLRPYYRGVFACLHSGLKASSGPAGDRDFCGTRSPWTGGKADTCAAAAAGC